MKKQKTKVYYNMQKIKRILENETNDYYMDGFYFPYKAVETIEKAKEKMGGYFLNSYYDYATWCILADIKEYKTLHAIKKRLREDYKRYMADEWYNNLLTVLSYC